MAITDILSAAQGGKFFANVAAATGLSLGDAETAISKFAPAIATKLKDKASSDPEAFENLLDLLEDGDGSDINDADNITSSESVSDGRDILEDLYGSSNAANTTLAKLAPDIDTGAVAKLGAISATSVLAVLSASHAQTLTGGASQAADSSGGGGLVSVIVGALVKGLVQGAQKQLAPKRRRRRYTSYYGRRRTTTRRRKRSIGIDDVFRDILGGRR
jgi:hypothetical protein